MSRGGLSIFLALLTLSVVAFLLMSALRIVLNLALPDETIKELGDQFWRPFLQISDAGAVAEDGDSHAGNKVLGILTAFIGLILFSSLVAFITSQFEARIQALKKGKSQVIESNHTLILGYTDRLAEIARELIVANESEKDAAIVILSEKDKEEMDDDLREKLPDRKTTRIVTRSGTISTLLNLRKVGASEARSIIVLNPAGLAANGEERATGDAIVLKAIMAVVASCSGGDIPPIVAELREEPNRILARTIAPGAVHVIDEDEVLAKILVQTSRISGLAIVYSSLVGFVGNEVYFYKPDAFAASPFLDVHMRFLGCSLLGFRRDGKIFLNPEQSQIIEASDELILLAEDDSAIKYDRNLQIPRTSAALPDKRVTRIVEKELIVGWNAKAPVIVNEYAKYLIEGSAIDVIVPEISDSLKQDFMKIKNANPALSMRMFRANVHASGIIQKLKPEEYDNAILLAAESDNSEEMDAHTIAGLLEFRAHFRGLSDVKTQLITEVKDSANIEIIMETGVKDFLISNQFVSKIYAQVSESSDVLNVYEDLFSPEGSEIYIKPLSLYFEIPGSYSFADLVVQAAKRNETCFGVKLRKLELDMEQNYGVILNPAKKEKFDLTFEDSLIVLAEDET
ncbi:MAG: hypothetical protein JNM27_18780 [Leptospirales bacterium]|nr:hypothetical protein [Leptospirales bacterium]